MIRQRIQLGMIHVAVAMTLVPINSTLNRVMIKELAISATLVAVLASLPYLFAPVQVTIGSLSDRFPVLGYRRTPYVVLGLFLCVVGLVISPQAAYLMAENLWAGIGLGILAFGAWGMGYNFSAVCYLSLATELSGEKGRGKTVAVMWFMMIVSIILTAIGLSRMIDPYTPEAMARAFWVIGLIALFLGLAGLVRLEPRMRAAKEWAEPASESQSWKVLFRAILDNRQATFFFVYLTILLAALLGQDILLEPFGGEAFGMAVKETTRITSIWGGSFLVALLIAGILEGRLTKRSIAIGGGIGALAGFILIATSGVLINSIVFYIGLVLLGIGSGLSTVSNLSLMFDMTTTQKVGLFIGAWGMSTAIARLLGSVLGGVVRDAAAQFVGNPVIGYVIVFCLEGLFVLISLFMLRRIDVKAFRKQAEQPGLVERAAMAGDAG